jgi:hypothetical protein
MMNATVNDVMTTTVVAVKQGASYKEMAAETADLGRNLMNRIRHVTGVVAVRDELSWPPAERSIAGLYF